MNRPLRGVFPPCLLALAIMAYPTIAQSEGRDAKQLHSQLCVGCHGDGQNSAKASSLMDEKWIHGDDDTAIQRNILQGIPPAGMPAFASAVSEAEARALVVYLRESGRRAVAPEPKGFQPLPTGPQSSEVERYSIELVAEGFNVPWSIVFLPQDRILVSERVGHVRLVEKGQKLQTPLEGVPPVWIHGEGGLLSLASSPDFSTSGWIYLALSDPGPKENAMTKIIRARLRDRGLTDHQVIFESPKDRYTVNETHFGSRLLFDGDYLFFTVGERGEVGAAQDLTKPNGKVHRVFWDGRAPPDNPFAKKAGAIASIWSYGHRNPQGLARDPRTGDLWETEHGPRGGDELNHIVSGKNYGWPIITYGMNYDGTPISNLTAKDGMEQPAAHWTPSIATCPIHFYTGEKFPKWKNELFLGSLAQQELRRITVDRDRVTHQELVFKHLGRVRDIQTGPDGLLYVALELSDSKGRIIRLKPAE